MANKLESVAVILAILAVPVVPALLMNLRDDGWRFRFKTVLLGMTLLAVLLGLLGYLVPAE